MRLLLISLVILLAGCGSLKKTTTSSSTEKTVSNSSVESSSSSITELSQKNTRNQTQESETEITTTETTLTPVILKDADGNESVVSVPTNQKTTTIRTGFKQSEEEAEETNLRQWEENNHVEEERAETDISTTHEAEKERVEAKNPKYVFWSILLVVIVLVAAYLQRKLKIL